MRGGVRGGARRAAQAAQPTPLLPRRTGPPPAPRAAPVLINMAKLQATIELALDDIGCRDGFCHEGARRARCRPTPPRKMLTLSPPLPHPVRPQAGRT